MRSRPGFDPVLFDLDGVLTATASLHAAAWKLDLDGVLTATASLHAAAWKQTFDAMLEEPFDLVVDDLAEMVR